MSTPTQKTTIEDKALGTAEAILLLTSLSTLVFSLVLTIVSVINA